MDQDGKPDLPSSQRRAKEPPTASGNLILTLCLDTDNASGYRHATIPFPSTYQEACAEALKTFAAHIPADTEAVSLCQAVKRKNGQYVWSAIREDLWGTIMQGDGDEVGVFLPWGLSELDVPYLHQDRKAGALVRLECDENICMRVVRSYEGLLKDATALEQYMWFSDSPVKLSYDMRMLGSRSEQEEYRNQSIGRAAVGAVWGPLDAELFNYLVNLQPETLWVRVGEPVEVSVSPQVWRGGRGGRGRGRGVQF